MGLEFHLISTKSTLNSESVKLLNSVYQLWQEQWNIVYCQKGSAHQPLPEDFLRYDYVTCLLHEKKIVGMSAHTFYNLNRSMIDRTEFLQLFGNEFIQMLKARELTDVASYESLLVAPQFRINEWNLPIGRLLILLGNFFFTHSPAQALIATGRKDVKVSEIARKCGYEVFISSRTCRGFECDLIVQSKKYFEPKDDPLFHIASRIWQSRNEHVGSPLYIPPSYTLNADAA